MTQTSPTPIASPQLVVAMLALLFSLPLQLIAAPISEVVVVDPDITVQSTLDFGTVVAGSFATRDLVIANDGDVDLTVTGTALTGDPEFVVTGVTGNSNAIPPGGSVTVMFRFTPSGDGPFSAVFSIESNDPDESPAEVTLEGMGQAAPVPDITVTPPSLAYGSVDVGQQATLPLVISNDGDAVLTVTAATFGGDRVFTVTGVDGNSNNLAPGGAVTVDITFLPTSGATFNGTLSIVSNDPDEPVVQVPLSGTGIGGPDPGGNGEPDIDVDPAALAFGSVAVGDMSELTLSIHNVGDATLVVSATELSGDPAFSVANADGNSSAIGAGETVTVTFKFAPTSAGPAQAVFAILSNDPDEEVVQVPLTGMGIGGTAPDIDVSPLSVDFGNVAPAGTATQTITITNEGDADLVITATSLTGDSEFSVTGATGTSNAIPPAGSATVDITFAPTAPGTFAAVLSLTSNDPDEGTVDVNLEGASGADAQPEIEVVLAGTRLLFGEVPVGGMLTLPVMVRNIGDADLIVTDFLTGGSPTFSAAGGTFTLAPGESQPVEVKFQPTSEKTFRGRLRIFSNDDDENPVRVGLTGMGVQAPDVTEPDCEMVDLIPGPPTQLIIRVADNESGLSHIDVLKNTNASISFQPFVPGTTDDQIVTATKINPAATSTVVIEVFDIAGNSRTCDPVVTTLSDEIPDAFALDQNYPNPFNPTTSIDFQVVESDLVSIVVYDLVGREVIQLVNAVMEPGRYSVSWDGTDASGRPLATGQYIYSMRSGGFAMTRVMTLLK